MGIEAGHAAGARVVAVPTTNSRETLLEAGADRVVERLDELNLDALRELFKVSPR